MSIGLNLPFCKKKDIIGIDLRQDELIITYLYVQGKKMEFVNFLSYSIKDITGDEVSKIVAKAVKDLNIKNPHIISVIPSHLTITKNLEIPSLDGQEIKEIIDLQAGRHTPYAREEVIIDYMNIGAYRKSYTKVLLVIVNRSTIKKQIDILTNAGLRIENIFYAPEGISNICSQLLKGEFQNVPVGIIHVDKNFTDFIIALRGIPIFARGIPLGIIHLTDDINSFLSKLAAELKRSLEAYQAEDIEGAPQLLVLTGSIEQLKEQQSILAKELNISLKVIDYLANLPINPKASTALAISRHLSFFNVASVLINSESMRVSLIPDEIKLRRSFEERAHGLIKMGIYIICIFIFVGAALISELYFKGAYLEQLNVKYQSVNNEAQVLEKGMERIRIIKHYLKNRGYPLEVLMAVYQILPKNIMLTDIKMDNTGNFYLKGTARAMSDVFSFVVLLEESSFFSNVQTNYTTSRKEKDEDWADFGISCVLEREQKEKAKD